MKLVIVTQWVIPKKIGKVPSDQSVAGRSVAKSAGKPRKGSPEPDGTRIQARVFNLYYFF